ncbi:hypothetical protein PAMA_010287 [Pampus argenteus]
MAAAATRSENSGIFWMNGVSDEEQPLVFVPGVDGVMKCQTPFSLGPGSTTTTSKKRSKMQAPRGSDCKNEAKLKKGSKQHGHLQSGRSGVYAKEKVSVHPSAAVATEHNFSLDSSTALPLPQVTSETSRAQAQVCLKDLCPEDKRRIANLIEELARVSEEKEESVQRRKDEQEHFECKIQQLEQQNLIIAQERGSLQQQYRECQELLGLYKQYLSQQQAKLNQSISQLIQAPAHSQVLSSEEAPSRTTSRANGPLFDGSYLSLGNTWTQQPQVHRSSDGRRGAVQTVSSNSCLPDSEFNPADSQINQHRIQKRECRESHSESRHSCELYQGSCQDSGYGIQKQRSDHEYKRLQNGNGMISEAKEALTSPLLGHENWEEKRHQLLLQKMQLEMERERLQARLAEQEERLNRQNQQLHQSRLDYKRLQEATQSELSSSNTKNGNQSDGPSQQDLPSSVYGDAEVPLAQQSLHEKCSPPVPASQDNIIHTCEGSERSRKDMATSPAKSSASMKKPTLVPVTQKSPEARLDFSVCELLDIFSPVSAPQQCKPSTRRPRTSQHTPKSVCRPLLTPAGSYPPSTQLDLEESQILEDIFFIC